MVYDARGFEFTSLKDCLIFLDWLNTDRKSMLPEVASELLRHLKNTYENVTEDGIKSVLSNFLGDVDTFYKKLVKDKVRYDAHQKFGLLGGGGWKNHYPGIDRRRWVYSWATYVHGGDLQGYLTATYMHETYGKLPSILPGGFGKGDVRDWHGYTQGKNMCNDLEKILGKNTGHNFFRDIFSTSIISNFGHQVSNTANVLALVKTFCEVVSTDSTGKSLEDVFETDLIKQIPPKCIDWNSLKAYCSKLKTRIDTLFTAGGFDYNGQAAKIGEPNQINFAKRAAEWFRTNLSAVQKHLNNIPPYRPGGYSEFAEHSLFPNGFVFGEKTGTLNYASRNLQKNWNDVIIMLGAKDDEGLNKLKRILDGENCQEHKSPTHSAVSPKPPITNIETTNPVSLRPEAETKRPRMGSAVPKIPKIVHPLGDSIQHHPGPKVQGPSAPLGPRHTPIPTLLPVPAGQPDGGAPSSPAGIPPGQQPAADQVKGPALTPSVSGSDAGSIDDQGTGGSGGSGGDSQDVSSGATESAGSIPGGSGVGGGGGMAVRMGGNANFGNQYTPLPEIPPIGIPTGRRLESKQPSVLFHPTVIFDDYALPEVMGISATKLTGSSKRNTQAPDSIDITPPFHHMLELRGHNTPNTQLKDPWPLPTPIQKPTGTPLQSAEPYPPDPVQLDTQDKQKYLDVSDIILTKSTGNDITAPAPLKMDTHVPPSAIDAWAISNPKRKRPVSPPPASKLPKTPPVRDAKIPSVVISPDHRVSNTLMSQATGEKIPGLNQGPPLPPLATSKPTGLPSTTPKSLETLEFDDQTIEKMLSVNDRIIKNDANKLPIAYVPTDDRNDILLMPEISVAIRDPQSSQNHKIPDVELIPVPPPDDKLHITVLPARDNVDLTTQDVYGADVSENLDIEVRKPLPPEPLCDHDPTYIPEIPKPRHPKLKVLDDFSEKPSDRAEVIIPLAVFPGQSLDDPDVCRTPWHVAPSATDPTSPPVSPPPASDHLPPPNTIREMLCWMVVLNQNGYIPLIEKHVAGLLVDINNDVSQPSYALEVTGDPTQLTASHVSNTLTQACLYAAIVLHKIKHKDNSKAVSVPDFSSEYSKFRYSTDPARLLCQLRDYVYACCHQLAFLKSQCSRNSTHGGWQDCEYGRDVMVPNSPLQDFLTDAPDSKFETHPFNPCDICLKSRINMGFTKDDLPEKSQNGNHLHTILSPTCGGEDPLLTLSSYLTCLTRRTPRTTGELVSFFHNFGNELHKDVSGGLSPLGSALTTRHGQCPDWDCLKEVDLRAIKDARGSANPNSINDQDHPRTLSTMLGCGIDNANCPQLMMPTTYSAYALYSQAFAHDYLSWAVYLPDRLWESMEKLNRDLRKHTCSHLKSLNACPDALPLLYTHGFTPPEVTSRASVTCLRVIAKLKEVALGGPLANLMTCMDDFLYRIRFHFFYTVIAFWSAAFLLLTHTMLYRLDVLRIRSHLLTTTASHLIDVKALLSHKRKVLSLYDDVDYFDDEPMGQHVSQELSHSRDTLVPC
ncbi:Ribosome-binding protein 1 [Babesia ovata]|uniref:Ribosome-binding protein 1 n=1 Tax=Babesia ovata TaxID=189622 RepID=A0A2H6KHH9_9APIC|nr:Ribosome-binding protein 1 [Babesia ovata]GBE62457.1 Ribosome-binding protein 1 [Babesia ovata]